MEEKSSAGEDELAHSPAVFAGPSGRARDELDGDTYRGLLKKAADLRKLNAELNKQSQSVASEADAVLSSASNNGAGGSSSAHGKAALKPRTGENRSPNPLKLTSSRAAAGAGTPKSRPKSATRSTEGVGLSCPPSREEEAVTKGAEDHAAAELKISTSSPRPGSAGPGSVGSRPGSSTRRESPRPSVTAAATAEAEEEDELGEGLSAEALVRIQKARISVMQKQLHDAIDHGKEMDKKAASLEAEVRRVIDEKRKLAAKAKSLEATLEKAQRVKSEQETVGHQKTKEVETLDRELQAYKKAVKQLESENKNKEVRLNRALEEAERAKAALAAERTNKRGDVQQERKDVEKLEGEVKKLERQKNELLAAFKKQSKLISLLKRQKLHLEAARVLSFTEEEFMRVLEWA